MFVSEGWSNDRWPTGCSDHLTTRQEGPLPATSVRDPGRPTFAARLNLLFEASAPQDPECPGRYVEYTNQQVADEINHRHGAGTSTAEYIRRLREEGGPQPTAPYMSVLADFFGVPLDVFNLTSGAANKTAAVITELERFLNERRPRQGPGETKTLAVLARSASRYWWRGSVVSVADTERRHPKVTVVVPEEPPELTPAAARALWEFLLDAHDQLHTQQRATARPANTFAAEAARSVNHAR
ncbi:hypothetical protein AB0I10_03140 [Streptomyces sp. NPDC050636]|uniref:hypothetical protein n=1 Tax=Streptomyces sp. NPDC050636 TaxID=3154510 RepID=UPI00342862E3